MAAPMPSPVTTYHTRSYPAISTDNQALSQKGQNVFITGASQGIGREMAFSFAKANVLNLAILGRKHNLIDEVAAKIKDSYPNVTVHVYTADLTDFASTEKAFSSFASSINGPIHTLVANAGYTPGFKALVEADEDHLMSSMNLNLRGLRNSYRAFLPHIPKEVGGSKYKAKILHTSTGAAHTNMPYNSSYSVAKVAAAKYMEFVALEHPEIQVISFHPGLLQTQMAADVDPEAIGLTFDDISLPADYAVWAASSQSAFLGSGRFTWAHWDVTELAELFRKYASGELKDGFVYGPYHMSLNFTLGLLNWP